MHKPTILLADDHNIILEAFRNLLEHEYEIVGTVADGIALLKVAVELKPDVVVIDIGMPLLNGLAAGQQLKQKLPKTKVIYVTMHEDPDLATEALRTGASGYVLKSCAVSELLKSIHEALRGGSYVTPRIKQGMMDSFIRSPYPRTASKKLTPRQTEVLELLVEGRSMKEVGTALSLTPRTVAFHKYRIMEVLNVKTSAELVQYAVRNQRVSR